MSTRITLTRSSVICSEAVKHPALKKGFVLLPRRRLVEHSFYLA